MAHIYNTGPRLAIYTMEQGQAIIEWAEKAETPKKIPIKVARWMTIEDPEKFIAVQLAIIKTYKPLSLVWVCAVERLEHLKNGLGQ